MLRCHVSRSDIIPSLDDVMRNLLSEVIQVFLWVLLTKRSLVVNCLPRTSLALLHVKFFFAADGVLSLLE